MIEILPDNRCRALSETRETLRGLCRSEEFVDPSLQLTGLRGEFGRSAEHLARALADRSRGLGHDSDVRGDLLRAARRLLDPAV